MLVVMKPHATVEEVQAVCDRIERLGYRPHPMPGAQRTAIGITGNQGAVEQDALAEMSGVAEVIKVSKPYKLVSRDVKEEDTVIHFPGTDAIIGGGKNVAIVAGPCSIESREQAFAIADQVAAAGAQFFRGGAYKPRTSPYAFQGMAEIITPQNLQLPYWLLSFEEIVEVLCSRDPISRSREASILKDAIVEAKREYLSTPQPGAPASPPPPSAAYMGASGRGTLTCSPLPVSSRWDPSSSCPPVRPLYR